MFVSRNCMLLLENNMLLFGSDMFAFRSHMSLLKNNMLLFGYSMVLFGNDMLLFANNIFLFGNHMFVFRNDMFLFEKDMPKYINVFVWGFQTNRGSKRRGGGHSPPRAPSCLPPTPTQLVGVAFWWVPPPGHAFWGGVWGFFGWLFWGSPLH